MSVKCLLLVVACAGILAGCGTAGSRPTPLAVLDDPQSGHGLRGDVLEPAITEPAITMTDTSGKPYNVARRAHGRVTLVYFGYTHCPDICPLFMADVASALRQSPATVRRDVTVDFITVDPRRDTSRVIRTWLDHFNPDFVGLRTSIRKVIKIQKAAHVPVSKVTPHAKHGYTVQHSALLLAITPDHKIHVAYTVGPSTITDLRHDLPILTSDRSYA